MILCFPDASSISGHSAQRAQEPVLEFRRVAQTLRVTAGFCLNACVFYVAR
jgi:hypothetical protein